MIIDISFLRRRVRKRHPFILWCIYALNMISFGRRIHKRHPLVLRFYTVRMIRPAQNTELRLRPSIQTDDLSRFRRGTRRLFVFRIFGVGDESGIVLIEFVSCPSHLWGRGRTWDCINWICFLSFASLGSGTNLGLYYKFIFLQCGSDFCIFGSLRLRTKSRNLGFF
jgi:hypothetical protein